MQTKSVLRIGLSDGTVYFVSGRMQVSLCVISGDGYFTTVRLNPSGDVTSHYNSGRVDLFVDVYE